MAYEDLRDWIAALERAGELKTIRTEVDPVLEITEITDRVSKNVGAGVPPVRASAARLGFVHTRAKSRLGFEESNQPACGALLRRTGEDTRP